MPSSSFYYRFGYECATDVRSWAGATVATGPNNIVLYAYSSTGEGLFRDVTDFLNGRQAPTDRSMGEQALALWTGPGISGVEVLIDENDRVYVETHAEAFTVTAAPEWGFSALAASVPAGGLRQRATADTDWTRGIVTQALIIDPTTSGAPYAIPSDGHRSQSAVIAMRSDDPVELSDADSIPVALTLQGADNAANDASNRIQWGLDDDGHVYRAYPTVAGPPITALVWADTDLRDRLGFSGDEIAAVIGSSTVLTAEYPCPGVVVPSRPADICRRWHDTERTSHRSTGSALFHVERSHLQGWRTDWHLDGPQDSGDDLWEHYLRRVLPLRAPGITLYQEWGETRRRGYAADGDTYGLLRTVQDYHGRVIAQLAPGEQSETTLELTARLRRRAPISTQVVEVPDA